MKQKLKEYKGITLIALIITIIVLLILAVVAIKTVNGNGILAHAENAKREYSGAQKKEKDILSGYELILAQQTGSAWKQEKTKVTRGDVVLEVGDTIANFKAGNKTWKVLGVENGKLLLTTESIITSKRITVYTAGWNENEKKFLTAEEELNNACTDNIKLTEEQDKQVSEIRSIKVEDIDRVTGYDKTTFGAENDSVYKYGNEVKYSLAKDENRNSNRNTISNR